MEFRELLEIVGREPVFETGLLLAGAVDPRHIRRQLVRWKNAGKIIQLRRGLYTLAPPYQRMRPHPFLVANRMVRASYVSLQSALAHAGLIPEYVPVTTSVTTERPNRWETPLGVFDFRHIQASLFFGYRNIEISEGQAALVARSEKALIDLVYLEPGADSPEYLRELRLQHLERLNLQALSEMAARAGKPKLERAVDFIARLAQEEEAEYEEL
jgi:predicted transcriptional regulator of viral defense system